MKFIVTKELGRLAKWLRILGYDAKYFDQDKTSSLIIASLKEERTILTRNSKLSKHLGVKIINIKGDFVKDQLRQVINELNLKPDEKEMFSRCVICNELLKEVEKERVKERIPIYVCQTQSKFVACPTCKRVYWQGTHWGNVQKYLSQIG